MNVLSGLEPKNVFHFFEQICAIPHGSYHTKAISDYLVAFAKERGLKYRQDEANNVIIWKGATPGYENAPTVMLQGHMDMVCEKDPDCAKDMETESLDLFVDGDEVGARGTTYYDCYLREGKGFVRLEGYPEIPDPYADPETGRIYGTERDAADAYAEVIYEIRGHAVELVEEHYYASVGHVCLY
jgi:di/tripeptidase